MWANNLFEAIMVLGSLSTEEREYLQEKFDSSYYYLEEDERYSSEYDEVDINMIEKTLMDKGVIKRPKIERAYRSVCFEKRVDLEDLYYFLTLIESRNVEKISGFIK